jgi:2-oxoglutarate dehydrogenase E2 component (dihydrolipoamide succinyltransferase)
LAEKGMDAGKVKGSGPNGRITKSDVSLHRRWRGCRSQTDERLGWHAQQTAHQDDHLRKKVAERLVSVKNQTAMLTTFNEVDMSAVMATAR